jgi:hypothetical protein
MKKFLTRALAFLLVQAVMAACVIGYGTPHNSNHYLGTMQDKIERLEACDGSRVVVLGGSNVAFGIHSEVLQDKTEMEAVNLGLHVSLGLPFFLECYRQHSHSGDIVVLCPEYHLLATEEHQNGDATIISDLLEQWPAAKQYFGGPEHTSWKEFLDHEGLWIAHQWVRRAFRRIRNKDTSGKIYYRSSFNEFGDMVAHHGRESVPLMPTGEVPPITPECIESTVSLLNDFADECEKRGVTVYLSYPPLLDSLYAESRASITQVHEMLQDRVRIPLLNSPDKFALPEEDFFDTAYHLTEQAGERRTQYIASAIRQRQVNSSEFLIAKRRDSKSRTE